MATGSISPNGANSWKPDVMAAFKTACESEGWVTQENGYNDGTYTRWVFRNGDSDFAVMFFCVTAVLNTAVSNQTSNLAAGLMFVVGEEYDTSTKELYRLAPLRNNWATAADCSIGATGYTPTKLVADGSSGPGYTGFGTYIGSTTTVRGVDFFWWSITSDQAFIGGHSAYGSYSSTSYYSFGIFTSLLPTPVTNDPSPVYIACLKQSSANTFLGTGFTYPGTSTGSVTRSAMNPSQGAHDFRIVLVPSINLNHFSGSTNYAYSTSGSLTNLDKYQGSNRPVCKVLVTRQGSQTTAAEASSYGHLRGELKDAVYWGEVISAGSSLGDELVIGSDSYYLTYPGPCVAPRLAT